VGYHVSDSDLVDDPSWHGQASRAVRVVGATASIEAFAGPPRGGAEHDFAQLTLEVRYAQVQEAAKSREALFASLQSAESESLHPGGVDRPWCPSTTGNDVRQRADSGAKHGLRRATLDAQKSARSMTSPFLPLWLRIRRLGVRISLGAPFYPKSLVSSWPTV
jgi:hypothetical protein